MFLAFCAGAAAVLAAIGVLLYVVGRLAPPPQRPSAFVEIVGDVTDEIIEEPSDLPALPPSGLPGRQKLLRRRNP